MQTFNQGLASAYVSKAISLDVALSRSSNPDELQDMINRGVTGPVGGVRCRREEIKSFCELYENTGSRVSVTD